MFWVVAIIFASVTVFLLLTIWTAYKELSEEITNEEFDTQYYLNCYHETMKQFHKEDNK